MLVHVPVACWLMTPLCDAGAIALGSDFFWRAGALIAGAGVLVGWLAAMAGALDYERAQKKAAKIVLAHAGLMGTSLMLATAGLIGRLDQHYHALTPPPVWAIAASALTFALMAVGAAFGGELVYGRGVHVRGHDG